MKKLTQLFSCLLAFSMLFTGCNTSKNKDEELNEPNKFITANEEYMKYTFGEYKITYDKTQRSGGASAFNNKVYIEGEVYNKSHVEYYNQTLQRVETAVISDWGSGKGADKDKYRYAVVNPLSTLTHTHLEKYVSKYLPAYEANSDTLKMRRNLVLGTVYGTTTTDAYQAKLDKITSPQNGLRFVDFQLSDLNKFDIKLKIGFEYSIVNKNAAYGSPAEFVKAVSAMLNEITADTGVILSDGVSLNIFQKDNVDGKQSYNTIRGTLQYNKAEKAYLFKLREGKLNQ